MTPVALVVRDWDLFSIFALAVFNLSSPNLRTMRDVDDSRLGLPAHFFEENFYYFFLMVFPLSIVYIVK